jgi:hypothetical protein
MGCEGFQEAIGELVEGTLDPAGRRALERHLEECTDCGGLVADLQSIRMAATTLVRHEPPPRVWTAIAEGIGADVAGHRAQGRSLVGHSRWRPGSMRPAWLAAAAALLVATTAAILSLTTPEAVPRDDDGGGADVLRSLQADLQHAEAHYQKAIDGLEAIARTDTGELDPQVAAVLQKNLQVIDQAIGESRAALRVQPASAPAQDSLFDAMRSKVTLLQQTVELINEMRKGNQAESARIVEGLGPS